MSPNQVRLEGYKDTEASGMAVTPREREFFLDNLLVRTHLIIEMILWTGLAP